MNDVLEVLQPDLSVFADRPAEDVLQPFQVLRRQLAPRAAYASNKSVDINKDGEAILPTRRRHELAAHDG